ncbi:MAG: dinitrogenase iron-molybdenum cofactor biosynthesis protein [Candidatus Dactylopiibacterium carminicum]|uniref:Dinitrogenase iron-molybdenum cofactor biosynthesis protein n=1 Tax=Candidatus Dactylopiibacterium carminicum TaxID=857335 RepID=A0A272EY61_9RHOO|nr:dinitrogenase iron-molybdenum cofactor biosynthesis protein [Candidatus Dactylopiibacterium carminicum]KAF7600414.1 dinitrogenase iron-molybdenum cofactor biosynthesis protein [Candidatus Dactylopiibacterium carminicum]PAS95035.1 MAG: dinitrogenase iron-molybdenum cofactor biosynthesis protein [Candidatus Dactylopiibacterium carminicum]PAS97856.1 MAG: dinitrogenase iron-molybdenum cofactor biosynthesis protein [Candidatus Dactylopiibacterium carminicum]PAT00414.1 MAG: dinitrogenase iron-moly
MNTSITREAALRIGLAALELKVAPRELTLALAEKIELPITEAKLVGCSVELLREAMDGDGGGICQMEKEDLKRAVRILWGEGVAGSDLPVRQPYQEGDMPGSIRLACASNAGEMLDGHFGSCERFLVYQVSATEMRLIELRSTLEAEYAEDKNLARAELIADCDVLYVQSIGGPAAAKVIRANVHPVKIPTSGPARDSVARLQRSLVSPPPWLARVMGIAPPSLAQYASELAAEEEA